MLAAGSGQRMGGAKARLVVGGAKLVDLHAARLREAGCTSVVMVVRADDADVVPRGALTAISAAPEPSGSLLVGMKLVPKEQDVLVITPIDVLPARADTIRALVLALEGDGVAATPTHEGQGGHPVVLRLAALDALTPYASLRDVLHALGPRRVRVVTNDAAIRTDLDTPADVVQHTGAPPAFIPK